LLPYLEQGNIYNGLNPTLFMPSGTQVWWGTNYGSPSVLAEIKIFQCPSDNVATCSTTAGIFAYLYTSSYTLYGDYFGTNNPASVAGATNYVASCGALGTVTSSGDAFYGQWYGPFDVNSAYTVGNIPDGTSNTIFFGETIGGTNVGARDFCFSWIGAGAQPTAWDTIQPSGWYSFGSNHVNVNFAFGDGSVRSITKCGSSTPWFSSQWYQFMYASGMADGSVIDWSQLGQ
jgi:prepilin-type processing-associated H-X9-DG protein